MNALERTETYIMLSCALMLGCHIGSGCVEKYVERQTVFRKWNGKEKS